MPAFLLSEGAQWYWFAGGAIALIIEMFMADLLPIGLSVSCAIFGVICWFYPDLYYRLEIGHFLILSTVIILASYFVVNPFLYQRRSIVRVTALADSPRDKIVGLTGVASQPFSQGIGRADVNGASWKCQGPDMEVGTPVVVTGVSGNRLIVDLVKV